MKNLSPTNRGLHEITRTHRKNRRSSFLVFGVVAMITIGSLGRRGHVAFATDSSHKPIAKPRRFNPFEQIPEEVVHAIGKHLRGAVPLRLVPHHWDDGVGQKILGHRSTGGRYDVLTNLHSSQDENRSLFTTVSLAYGVPDILKHLGRRIVGARPLDAAVLIRSVGHRPTVEQLLVAHPHLKIDTIEEIEAKRTAGTVDTTTAGSMMFNDLHEALDAIATGADGAPSIATILAPHLLEPEQAAIESMLEALVKHDINFPIPRDAVSTQQVNKIRMTGSITNSITEHEKLEVILDATRQSMITLATALVDLLAQTANEGGGDSLSIQHLYNLANERHVQMVIAKVGDSDGYNVEENAEILRRLGSEYRTAEAEPDVGEVVYREHEKTEDDNNYIFSGQPDITTSLKSYLNNHPLFHVLSMMGEFGSVPFVLDMSNTPAGMQFTQKIDEAAKTSAEAAEQ